MDKFFFRHLLTEISQKLKASPSSQSRFHSWRLYVPIRSFPNSQNPKPEYIFFKMNVTVYFSIDIIKR